MSTLHQTHPRSARALRRSGPLAALAGTLCLLMGSAAQATPLFFEGDQTSVLVTSFFFLTDAGLTVAPLGTAVIGDDVVRDDSNGEFRQIAVFPITGGDINALTGSVLVEHEGSGLELSTMNATVQLENFDIVLDGSPSGDFIGQLLGDVTVGMDPTLLDVPLFNLSACGLGASFECVDSDRSTILNGVRLGLTAIAAEVLNATFFGDPSGPLAENDQIGVARVDVRVVPEPGTLVLTMLGLIGLGHAGSKRRSAA